MREICLGSTLMDTASLPAPYTTAGTAPAARTRRAAFLVVASRDFASTSVSVVAISPQIGRWRFAFGTWPVRAYRFSGQSPTANGQLLSYANNLLTDVSSWIDWIALAISPAMEST